MLSINQFTLQKRSSVFDGMICNQRCDTNALLKIVHSDIPKPTFLDKKTKTHSGFLNYMQKTLHNEKNQFQQIVKAVDSRGNIVNVLGRDKPWGRFNCKGNCNIANVTRLVRHTITKDEYVDMDIDNCQVELVMQSCNDFGFQTPYLKKYTEDRANILAAVMKTYNVQRDDAKQYFIQSMFGGTWSGWVFRYQICHLCPEQDNKNVYVELNKQCSECDYIQTEVIEPWIPFEFIENYEKELQNLQDRIMAHNPELVEYVKAKFEEKVANYTKELERFLQNGQGEEPHAKRDVIAQYKYNIGAITKKPYYNIRGKVAAIWAQDKENDCIEAVYKCANDLGRFPKNNFIHCADGVMMQKDMYEPGDLERFQQAILNKTGFHLKMSLKPIDKGYSDAELMDRLTLDIFEKFGWNSFNIAQFFNICYGQKFISVKGIIHVYNGVYFEADDEINSKCTRMIGGEFQPFLDNKFTQCITELQTIIAKIEKEYKPANVCDKSLCDSESIENKIGEEDEESISESIENKIGEEDDEETDVEEYNMTTEDIITRADYLAAKKFLASEQEIELPTIKRQKIEDESDVKDVKGNLKEDMKIAKETVVKQIQKATRIVSQYKKQVVREKIKADREKAKAKRDADREKAKAKRDEKAKSEREKAKSEREKAKAKRDAEKDELRMAREEKINVKLIESERTKFIDQLPEKQRIGQLKLMQNLCRLHLLNSGERQKIFKDIHALLNRNVKMDANPDIFTFENRIVDLLTGQDIKPDPSLYITQSCGYPYYKCYNPNVKRVLMELIRQIFPDPEIKKTYLIILSTMLTARLVQKLFIAKGVGGNGKSLLHALVLAVLGKFGVSLSPTVLTVPITSGCNVDLAQCIGVRGGFIPEPEGPINSSNAKILTGNETLPVRGLYEKATGVKNTMTSIVESNGDLQIPPGTHYQNTKRRLKVIEFGSEFHEQEEYNRLEESARDDNGHHYKQNESFTEFKFKELIQGVLFDLLLEHYKYFVDNDFKVPENEACEKSTMDFMENDDILYQWFTENYEVVSSESCEPCEVLRVKDIFETFKLTEFYTSMSYREKRTFNQTTFAKKIKGNLFLQPFLIKGEGDKNVEYENVKYYALHIHSWKRK